MADTGPPQMPLRVELTPEEAVLFAKIDFEPGLGKTQEQFLTSAEAALALTESLISRRAVAPIRLRYFTEGELNPGGRGRSHVDVFEHNGTRGDDIYRHAHFLPYLRYFLFGPQLPELAIEEFCAAAKRAAPITSGDIQTFWTLARRLTRQFGLNSYEAGEEFFKLALECGMHVGSAKSIRKQVLAVR